MSRQRSRVLIGGMLAVGIVLAIAALAIAAYRVTSLSKPHPARSSPSLSAQSIVSSLGMLLPKTYLFLHSIAPSAQTTVGYQYPGQHFQIALPVTFPSVAFSDASAPSEQAAYSALSKTATYINSYLVRQGFASISSQDQTSGLLSAVYFYRRSDAVCQVSIYADIFLTCAPVDDLQHTAVQAQPLVAVYEAAAPGSGIPVITAPDIRASKTADYTIATLLIYNNHGETSANFYKQGSSSWQMVNLNWYNDPHEDADIMPNCEDFESYPPVRGAFAGQACYDSIARMTRTVGS